MGGDKIGPWLMSYAARCHPGSAIVEVGCWLGAGTVHLARGAMKSGASIHCYDRWCCTEHEARKASEYGLTLTAGEDLLPRFHAALPEFPVEVVCHQGDFAKAEWSGGSIGLYVDDASKRAPLWAHAMATFKPSFIPGETVLVLMDYHYDEKAGPEFAAQKAWMAEHSEAFEVLEERLPGITGAVFRYVG